MKLKLLILIMISAVAFSSCKKELVDTSMNDFEDVNSNQTFEEIIASGVTLAFFHASWCHNCEEQRPAIEAADADPQLDFVKFIEIEYEDNKEITQNNNVPGFPTQIIFKDGVEKERLTGKGHTVEQITTALLKYE
ncbi:MAG: thioredoxin family protein [Bacteroidia bacterium]